MIMVSQHLVDRPVKLATCPRCSGYVLTGHVSGMREAVDPQPLPPDALRAALLAGKRVFRLEEQGGRPWMLRFLGPRAAHAGLKILAEHGCAVRSARPVEFEELPANPPQAPVTPGESVAGLLQPLAPVLVSQWAQAAPSPVTHANHPRSRVDHNKTWLYRRCEKCGEQMGYEDAFGVKYGETWIYVWHDPCPAKEVEDA
jgi:hypothetical protein